MEPGDVAATAHVPPRLTPTDGPRSPDGLAEPAARSSSRGPDAHQAENSDRHHPGSRVVPRRTRGGSYGRDERCSHHALIHGGKTPSMSPSRWRSRYRQGDMPEVAGPGRIRGMDAEGEVRRPGCGGGGAELQPRCNPGRGREAHDRLQLVCGQCRRRRDTRTWPGRDAGRCRRSDRQSAAAGSTGAAPITIVPRVRSRTASSVAATVPTASTMTRRHEEVPG